MTKKVFSCILIGLGDIGLNYDLHRDQSKYIQTHSRAFFLNSGFDMQGGVDINSDACDTFTKKYNVKFYLTLPQEIFLKKFKDCNQIINLGPQYIGNCPVLY